VQKHHVRGVLAPNWKNGRDDNHKYPRIHIALLTPEEQQLFASMIIKGKSYISEHRLVMARHLGRPLRPNEIVHHVNGITHDNRLENLRLVKRGQHCRTHTQTLAEIARLHKHIEEQDRHIESLEKRIAELQ